MGRKRTTGEKRTTQICIAVTPTEFKMMRDARDRISEQRGREISMREFIVSLCKTFCYDMAKDNRDILSELDHNISNVKQIRQQVNNLIYDLQSMKEGLYGPSEDPETEE